MRRELAAYPGLVDILMTRANHGPGALRLVETVLGILADAGLDERRAVRHYVLFIDLVLGRLHRELLGDPMDHHRTASLLALAEEVGEYPRLRAAGPYLREVTSRQVFDDEIAMLILAIESSAREA
jgi:hypothetical protein